MSSVTEDGRKRGERGNHVVCVGGGGNNSIVVLGGDDVSSVYGSVRMEKRGGCEWPINNLGGELEGRTDGRYISV
jgi:hypothetical protein